MAENKKYLAHRDGAREHVLRDHLVATGNMARIFAGAFDSGDWGWLMGVHHDIGKALQAFQDKLYGSEARVDHSTAGALHVLDLIGKKAYGLCAAFGIAGHHSGLSDEAKLSRRLNDKGNVGLLDEVLKTAPGIVSAHEVPELPWYFNRQALETLEQKHPGAARRRMEMWVRMLFSCLVDADFLDTEAFYKPERVTERTGFKSIDVLLGDLDKYLVSLTVAAPQSPVNQARGEMLERCRAAAELSPGFFSLEAPTGGAKTMNGMAFALKHASIHGFKRVICVIPSTSIIEQNAQKFRDAFGEDSVVEHHSALDPTKDTAKNSLAAENWDAPIVVTTTVQFFESLFARRTSRCRKLHNIANSVVVLDEVQALPPGKLAPVLEVLRELVECYGVSVVFCTATQPALAWRERFKIGLVDIRPIMPHVPEIKNTFRRANVFWPADIDVKVSWSELASKAVKKDRTLTITSRRQDARDLLAEMDAQLGCDDTIHLSALMCAAHRIETVGKIKNMLSVPNQPVRVVSTQVIEAGVCVDFPCVFRALAGLDSIAQAYGRCNREGLLVDANGNLSLGRLVVFVAPTAPPPGVLTSALDITKVMLRKNPNIDPTDPDVMSEFFTRLYSVCSPDEDGIQALRGSFCFESVAERFRMIDEWAIPVVVPWGESSKLIEAIRHFGPSKKLMRAIQRYVVNLSQRDVSRLEKIGAIELISDAIFAVTPGYEHMYSDRLGLVVDNFTVTLIA